MNTQRGSDSYLLFALNKDNAPNTPIDDLVDVDKLVYNIVSADLARDTEVVTIEESSASANPQVPEAARIRTQGNVVYNLRGQNMQRILQHALWTKTPIQKSSKKTKELYAAGSYTNGTAISVSTAFSEVGLAKVSVTLAGSRFEGSNTKGTVDVVGTDKDGEAQTVTLTFNTATGTQKASELFATITAFTVNDIEQGTVSLSVDNEKSDGDLVTTTKDLLNAQAYTTGEAVAVETQAGVDIEPARAVVTLASSSFVTGKSEGSVKVIGTDMDDLEISDTLVFSSATGTERSTEFFKTITSFTVLDIKGGTVALSVDNERKEVVFMPGGSPLFGTLELNRGADAPIVYDRVIATGFSIEVSGNGSVRLTVNYAGRQAVKKTLEGEVRNGDGLHGLPVEFSEVNDSVFLAFGTVVVFGGVVLSIRDMNLNVDQNYDVQGYLTGERPYAIPDQNSQVTAVLTGTVKYAYDETYSDTFIQNRFVKDFALKFLRAPSGKPKDETEFRFGRGKLSTDPDRVSISQGVVEQSIEISLLGSEGATVTDYLTLFVRSSEGLYGDVFVG